MNLTERAKLTELRDRARAIQGEDQLNEGNFMKFVAFFALFSPGLVASLADMALVGLSLRAGLLVGRDDVSVQPFDTCAERLKAVLK